MRKRTELWSSGGGTQSSAIAALIIRGELPKPDLACIADTGYEMSTTWKYMEKHVAPGLAAVGVTLHRVKSADFATVGLYRNDDLLIPAYTSENGQMGKMPTFCSNEWKQRVVRRWASSQGVKAANVWIGFTIDEARRMKPRLDDKWRDYYPLISMLLTRQDCEKIIMETFGEPAPRSSCYMCPNKNNSEWAWTKANAPDDFVAAQEFERGLQVFDPDVWLHRSGKPIGSIPFVDLNEPGGGKCEGGQCFV